MDRKAQEVSGAGLLLLGCGVSILFLHLGGRDAFWLADQAEANLQLVHMLCKNLFVTQGNDGINPHGAARRHIAGEQRHSRE